MSTLFTFLLLQVFARPMTGKKHDKILGSLVVRNTDVGNLLQVVSQHPTLSRAT